MDVLSYSQTTLDFVIVVNDTKSIGGLTKWLRSNLCWEDGGGLGSEDRPSVSRLWPVVGERTRVRSNK